MSILTNKQSKNFKTTIYLTKFRLKHNDTNLKLRLKSNLFLLLAILAIPFILIFITKDNFVFSKNIQTNDESENQIINGKFKAPISGVITSEYGYRIDPISKKTSKHTGVDIAGSIHCEVKSITDGIVTFAGIQNRIW